MTKKTFNQWRQRTGIPVAALILCAALFAGCSHDDDAGLDSGDPVAVQFTASVDGVAVPSAKAAGTRNTTQGFTGITDTGVPYRDYTDADGFATRAFYPGGASRHTELAGTKSGEQNGGTGGRNLTTRTSDNGSGQAEWVSGDRVGIFMLNTGGNLPGGISSGADNVEYKATPDGSDAAKASFAPADAGGTIYYPQSGAVDFVAYYPYGDKGTNAGQVEDNTYIYKVSVADQSNPAAIDVLYAKATNVSKSKNAVGLVFDHKMSRVTLNVTLGDGLTGYTGSNITAASFSGMPLTATMALQDGTLTAEATGTFSPRKTTTQSGADATFSAILVPQPTGGTGRTVTFTVAGTTYTWTIPNGDDFAAANHYTYPVTIQQSGVTVGKPTITPWTGTEGDPTPGTAELLPVETVKIKAGTFQMGSPGDKTGSGTDANGAYDDEKPQHWVQLTQDFYMSRYEITNAQYTAFLNTNSIGSNGQGSVTYYENGSPKSQTQTFIYDCTTDGRSPWGVKRSSNIWEPVSGYEDYPVIYVTWYGAKAYADWLSQTTGIPCTLPTEAQWEYACRAGTQTLYSYGDAANGDYMWYSVNSDSHTHKVGETNPNRYGLYDMHGNVWEWCLDQWDGSENYPTAPNESGAAVDPLVTAGNARVLRGGSWDDYALYCRSAYRHVNNPDYALNYYGFRVVFVP